MDLYTSLVGIRRAEGPTTSAAFGVSEGAAFEAEGWLLQFAGGGRPDLDLARQTPIQGGDHYEGVVVGASITLVPKLGHHVRVFTSEAVSVYPTEAFGEDPVKNGQYVGGVMRFPTILVLCVSHRELNRRSDSKVRCQPQLSYDVFESDSETVRLKFGILVRIHAYDEI